MQYPILSFENRKNKGLAWNVIENFYNFVEYFRNTSP